jgi:ubiquinone/menaquinone biosynthesis C-methylase UbiE
MNDVDLGRLARAYDYRGQSGDSERARRAAAAAGLRRGDLVVDVGGGRGGHAGTFRSAGSRVVVVDPEPEMVAAAGAPGVCAVIGRGECLPLAADCAALVYFHLSIHHGDADAMLGEAERVVAPGGTVWVWTLSPAHHRSSFLARWFPSVAAIDESRFQHPPSVAARLTALGFESVATEAAPEEVTRSAGSWEAAVRAGFVSTLHLLDPSEVEEGLERFRKEHPDPAEVIRYGLDYCGISGVAPDTRH